jgi:hypothetical protein
MVIDNVNALVPITILTLCTNCEAIAKGIEISTGCVKTDVMEDTMLSPHIWPLKVADKFVCCYVAA